VLLLAKFRQHSDLNVREILIEKHLQFVFTVTQHEVEELITVIHVTFATLKELGDSPDDVLITALLKVILQKDIRVDSESFVDFSSLEDLLDLVVGEVCDELFLNIELLLVLFV